MVQTFRTPLDGLAPIDFGRLTEQEQRRYLQILRLNTAGESLTEFIATIAPDEPPPPHLQVIIRAFERARTEKVRLCISMPPGAGKSITIRRGLAWWLKHRPADLCCYATYNSDLARDQSRYIRDLCGSAGIMLADDSNAANNWRTPDGGGLFAAGLNSGITGRRVQGIAVVDDPYPSMAGARSEAIRATVKSNFNTVIRTRGEGWSSIIVVHTRWSPDDLIGDLEREGGWEVINIPAIARMNDPIGRQPGEPIWPDREQFTLASLLDMQRIDEFGFAALYQGEPIAEGTRIFHGEPLVWDPRKTDLTGCTVLIGADPAATASTSADFSAAIAMAVRPPFSAPTVYLLDAYHQQVTIPQGCRDLLAFQYRNYGAALKVESVAGFKATPQLLREMSPGLKVDEIVPKGDKWQRAQLYASAWNNGRVLIPLIDPYEVNSPRPRQPSWVEPYKKELREFTGMKGGRDDQVDASSNAYNEIIDMRETTRRGAVADPGRWK